MFGEITFENNIFEIDENESLFPDLNLTILSRQAPNTLVWNIDGKAVLKKGLCQVCIDSAATILLTTNTEVWEWNR